MSEISFMGCVRFSLQLVMAEAVLVFSQPRRGKFLWRLILGGLGFLSSAGLIFYLGRRVSWNPLAAEVLYYFAVFALSLVFMRLLFFLSEKEILFVGIGGYAAQHLAFSLTQTADYIWGFQGGGGVSGFLYHGLFYILVPVSVYVFIIRQYQEQGELREKDPRMILLALVTIFITIVLSLTVRRAEGETYDYLQNFVCYVYGGLCCVLILYLLFHIPKENKLRRDQQILEQVVRVMGEQQKLSKESVEIINRKCHDIKHQLHALVSMEDSGERARYMEEIRQAISIYDAVYQTGNAALDFVLREKHLLCQEYRIQFSCMADGKALDFLDTLDIYALFGNALDNAIESVMKEKNLEKRLINMQVVRRARILHIHMDNYCKEPVVFEDGLPVTSKEDKACHGFGVRSIRHIAEKYDGNAVLKNQDQRFILDILIPVPEE